MRIVSFKTAILIAAFCAGIVISGCVATPKFTPTVLSNKEYKIQYSDSAATQSGRTLEGKNATIPTIK